LPSSAPPGDGSVRIGRVGKPHGLDGSFVVENASENLDRFRVGAVLSAGGEEARVVASKRARGRPVIRLDRSVERGAELTLQVSELPSADPGSYYVFELVGLAVEEQGGRLLGHVRAVEPGIANDVLELDSGLALPLHEECICDVDLAAGKIVVAPGFADPDYPH
jgi:16S rRNA processing protein RimM